ncbi:MULTISPECIES: CYTH domain-containing protein [Streptomyces]|uniref:CYTH domain-containing protein n=1 Tax=Streptomyces TaxID=1883 RepID=UPI0018FE8453|nr:CYTH domain-containing protein [Streptomyces sp. CB01201]MBX7464492.1 CYTH domain-containing protein [Streptomyces sp. MAG02]
MGDPEAARQEDMSMGEEIERRFLVAGEVPDGSTRRTERIEQGYLPLDVDGAEVRVRRRGGQILMTVKGGTGLVRTECEEPIPPALFDALWPLTEAARIAKERRTVALEGGETAEVDDFGGRLAGLAMVEVEFETAEAAHAFRAPSWFGREVTDDARYQNRSLARGEGVPQPSGPGADDGA